MSKKFETLEPSFVKTVFAESEHQATSDRQPFQFRRGHSRHRSLRPYRPAVIPSWPALLRRHQVIHSGGDAALAVRHTGQFERHFNRGERAEDHRLVQIAEMADAEDMAAQPVEPAAERHVELVEAELADF